MDTEIAALHNSREAHAIEDIGTHAPHVNRSIFAKTFIIESIHLANLARFVVSSEKCNSIRVAQFQAQQEEECFNAVVPAINVIPHKQVVGSRAVTSNEE